MFFQIRAHFKDQLPANFFLKGLNKNQLNKIIKTYTNDENLCVVGDDWGKFEDATEPEFYVVISNPGPSERVVLVQAREYVIDTILRIEESINRLMTVRA